MKSFFLVLVFSFCSFSQDWGSVNINKTSGGWEVILENSKILVKYSNSGSKQGVLYDRITHFLVKGSNTVLATKLDGRQLTNVTTHGYQITNATVEPNTSDKKTVKIDFGNGYRVTHVTIFKDNPVIKLSYFTGGHNLDYGIVGDNYEIFGADAWQAQNNWQKRYPTLEDNTTYSGSYYRSQWGPPGPLDYKGWIIMGVHSSSNGLGVGLILPSSKIYWIKLIASQGFERWMDAGPHTAYLYASEGGAAGVISAGQILAEGNLPVSIAPKISIPKTSGLFFQPLSPNPFKGSTTLQFNLPVAGFAEIGFYNINGKKIDHFNYRGAQAGPQRVIWRPKDNLGYSLSPGVYFCSIGSNGHRVNRQFNIIK